MCGAVLTPTLVDSSSEKLRAPIPFEVLATGHELGAMLESADGPALSADGQFVAYATQDPARYQVTENKLRTRTGVPIVLQGRALNENL